MCISGMMSILGALGVSSWFGGAGVVVPLALVGSAFAGYRYMRRRRADSARSRVMRTEKDYPAAARRLTRRRAAQESPRKSLSIRELWTGRGPESIPIL